PFSSVAETGPAVSSMRSGPGWVVPNKASARSTIVPPHGRTYRRAIQSAIPGLRDGRETESGVAMKIQPGRFAGRRAGVTGPSAGIGRAAALRFAAEGARVGLVARGREPLEAVASEIAASGGEALVLPADSSVA